MSLPYYSILVSLYMVEWYICSGDAPKLFVRALDFSVTGQHQMCFLITPFLSPCIWLSVIFVVGILYSQARVFSVKGPVPRFLFLIILSLSGCNKVNE